jgi:hypothetical protein
MERRMPTAPKVRAHGKGFRPLLKLQNREGTAAKRSETAEVQSVAATPADPGLGVADTGAAERWILDHVPYRRHPDTVASSQPIVAFSAMTAMASLSTNALS